MIAWLTLALALAAPPEACRTVEGDRILARDLAAALEVFGGLPPESEVAPAPAPGSRRYFGTAELARLAGRLGVPGEGARPVCFERLLRARDAGGVRSALERALQGQAARVELADFLRAPVPEGELEFPPRGLSRPGPGGEAFWRGRIRYAPGRTFPFWARVRVALQRSRVVARQALAAGRPIPQECLEVRTMEGFPFEPAAPASPGEVAGRIPRRPIPAGQPIAGWQLTAPREVEAGAPVEVEARVGSARLSFPAVAGSAGRAGDTVAVRNPQTGRSFKAVVQGKGKVAAGQAARENSYAQDRALEPRGAGAGGGSRGAGGQAR
ncbi:MAG: flagellar basal body P-ring formation protein FlgA [Acidobacteria bacterium]|nr:flagellar basal body P-ring formation protein FlgA [Acidobacteriota bacterium]